MRRDYRGSRRRAIDHLPIGTVSSMQFAYAYGIPVHIFKDHIVVGIDGDRIEVTQIPHGKRVHRYLTPEQQSKALAFWSRHGVEYRKPVKSEGGQ